MNGSRYANSALNRADVIIAVGTRFSNRVTGAQGKLGGLEQLLAACGVKEITRTGKIAISRNAK